jgi:hypothetical protein
MSCSYFWDMEQRTTGWQNEKELGVSWFAQS